MRAIQLTVISIALASQLGAGLITYSDRASFNADVSGQTVIDFESYSDFDDLGTGPTSETIGNATFSLDGGKLFVFGPGEYGTIGSKYLNHNNSGAGNITVSFADPVFAVGFDTASLNNWGGAANPGEMTLALSSGDSVFVSAPHTWRTSNFTNIPLQFIGFVSDTPITSFTILDPSDGVVIDDFAYAVAASSPIPEPSSLALLGMGGIGMVGYRWRRKWRAKPSA